MSERIINLANGVSLEVEVYGLASHDAVVWVSGAGSPLQFWPDLFVGELVSAGHQVIRYCRRDTGLSDHFDAYYPADSLLEDLRLLLRATGIAQAHLIGHSMGGALPDRAA